jgi:5-methylcytosine-specific restriction endonuclease McrA
MARKSTEKYSGQRNKEKRDLFRPYRLRGIEDLYKRRFFEHFGNSCFRCGKQEKQKQEIGAPPHLCMDHHVPMALGGHLVPGNLVSLCRACNERKLDRDPVEFYTAEELVHLQPLLETQKDLFAFSFNWGKWEQNREAYLLELGVDHANVRAALHDEYFVGYVGLGGDRIGITIIVGDNVPLQLAGTKPQ